MSRRASRALLVIVASLECATLNFPAVRANPVPNPARTSSQRICKVRGTIRACLKPLPVPTQPPAPAPTPTLPPNDSPPPAGGYLRLQPVGSWSRLPDDSEAAKMVRRSTWEPRPDNATANQTVPSGMALGPHGGVEEIWNSWLIPRISGNFTGTTDEIIQWAAAKWGLEDELLRAFAATESWWQQSAVGDVTSNQEHCPPGYAVPCPQSFGLLQIKHTVTPGTFPHSRDSTPLNVDYVAAILRGCYEGWETWLKDWGYKGRGEYAAGDMWGCVGRWYSGDWHTDASDNYITTVKNHLANKPWLRPTF